jgi:hypothetical protein
VCAVAGRLADADVAETGVGTRRRNAERRDRTALSMARGQVDRALQRRRVDDEVVRRHHDQDRVVARGTRKRCGKCQCRRDIAPHRLDDEPGIDAARPELLGDDESMLIAANDNR